MNPSADQSAGLLALVLLVFIPQMVLDVAYGLLGFSVGLTIAIVALYGRGDREHR